jgi:hypothetical protein
MIGNQAVPTLMFFIYRKQRQATALSGGSCGELF